MKYETRSRDQSGENTRVGELEEKEQELHVVSMAIRKMEFHTRLHCRCSHQTQLGAARVSGHGKGGCERNFCSGTEYFHRRQFDAFSILIGGCGGGEGTRTP